MPLAANASDAAALTVLTAADWRFWRCLYQFLLSAERQGLTQRHRFVAYDLGLRERRAYLEERFAWCRFRTFAFAAHPPHIGVDLRSCGWKPLVVADALNADGGVLLYLDSATLLKAPLEPIAQQIRRDGVYTLQGQSTLGRHCAPAVLDALGVPLETRSRPERAAGVLGLDSMHAGARRLVELWCARCLVPAYLRERKPPHFADQSLYSLTLYELAARGELRLGADQIDISSATPVRWLSTRNKVPPGLPTWLDGAARAYYAAYKAIDRAAIRLEALHRRLQGLQRWAKEHFTVYVASAESGAVVELRAPRLRYYADPFVWQHKERVAVFVEEFDCLEHRGSLCAIELDRELKPSPPRPLNIGGTHLSFPFLFEHGGTLYMVPESCADECVDLYACEEFPDRWRRVRRLLYGLDAADSTIAWHDGRWWLFTSLRNPGSGRARHLGLFHTDDLLQGEWQAHPVNARELYASEPHVGGRNAGALAFQGGVLLRPAQENRRHYGVGVRWMRIDTLDERSFAESPYDGVNPLAQVTAGVAPHHVSRHGNLLAWDVRDRVGYLRWRVRGDAPGAPSANLLRDLRCSG